MTPELRSLAIQEMVDHYARKPPAAEWPARAQRAFSEPADPCDADVLATFGWSGGLGSGFNAMASEVGLAVYFNKTVALCHRQGTDYRNFAGFDLPLRVCGRSELCRDHDQYDRALNVSDKPGEKARWGTAVNFWGGCLQHYECDVQLAGSRMPLVKPAFRHPGIDSSFRSFSRDFRHFLYGALWTLTPTERAGVDIKVAQWGPKEGPFVGIHLRGTDKFHEAQDPGVGAYAQQALAFLRSSNATQVFIASDDKPRLKDLKEQLLAAMPQVQIFAKSEREYPWRAGGHILEIDERQVMLAEIQQLVRATAFVGSASSNIGRAVYFLRQTQAGEVQSGRDLTAYSVDDDNDFFSRHC